MIAVGQFFFRFRNAIFPIAMLLAVLLASPRYSFGRHTTDLWVDLLGIAVILAGQVLRILTIGYEYIRRGGREGRVYANELVQGGVFAHCRNPLYLGNILMVAGFLVVIGTGWLIAVGLPLIILVYRAIVAAEEDYLSHQFGEAYAAYCGRVNRWLPDWKGFSESVGPMRFNWQRVVVKEYGTFFASLTALLVIQVWTRFGEEGVAERDWIWIAGVACLLCGGYLAARTLKKQRLLHG